MNLSRLFILRPVMTLLLSLSVLGLGGVAWRFLPVSPLPQVTFPVIMVSASLPGASPTTMAATVATPLERSLGTIAGIQQMTSRSSQGSTNIIIVFDLDRDINGAARDVQAAINASRSLLPSAMPSLPTYRKADPSDAPILMLSLTSATHSPQQLYDLASSKLAPVIAQVSGVGDVSLFGGSLPAIRVELQPELLAHAGISLASVRTAIANATKRLPKGRLEGHNLSWLIGGNDQLEDAASYRQLVVGRSDQGIVHLGDVARVFDSVEDVYNAGYYDGHPSVMLGVSRSANANMLATIDAIKARLPTLRKELPRDVQLYTAIDRSGDIRDALRATEETLLIAVILVVAVVFLFLRNPRATLIPALALPISLVGALAVMYLCGFSLNNLSLMALIIATGFVVDDAIVVLENISRHREAGMKPLQAALTGAREVAFTVLSMTLTLVAVFIPMLLMGGIVGRLFREFSVTLTAALLISMLVSLTLTPMLCARLLGPASARPVLWRFYGLIERALDRTRKGYMVALGWVMRHKRVTLFSLLLTVIGNGYLYVNVSKGFFPQQDTGLLYGHVRGDETNSFAATNRELLKVAAEIRQTPGVAAVMASVGGGRWGSRDSGRLFIRLEDFDQRSRTSEQIANALNAHFQNLAGYRVFLRPAQNLRFGGRSADAAYQFSLQADDLELLRTWTDKAEDAFKTLPQLTSVNSDAARNDGQALKLVVDRDAARRLGLSARDIDSLLGNAFSQRQVATLYKTLNQYHVIMGLAPAYLADPSSLHSLYLINDQGARVPLSAVARLVPGSSPTAVSHQDQMATNTLSFNLADGVALSQAKTAIEAALTRIGLPRDKIKAGFQGSAQLSESFASDMPWLILAALLVVYAVLGILYESYVHPLTILSTLPSAGVGALLLLKLFGIPLTVIALIGILLLIGIVKKNAIMLVDFALAAERQRGLTPEQAIVEACEVRFRPILMTSLAAFFGALPLALGTGADPSLRQPLGITIMGGLAASQLLTLFTTPVVYLYLDRFSRWSRRLWARWFGRDANLEDNPS